MKIKLFADGANLNEIRELSNDEKISGFTTNPTLMRKAGINDYVKFAVEAIKIVKDLPISLEVFSDDLQVMEKQALELSRLGDNVYVKIPVTNTKGESTGPIIKSLSEKKVKLNVTAVFTTEQVEKVVSCLHEGVPSIISVFAGRIADTGVDPVPHMKKCKKAIEKHQMCELLWASPREVLNLYQAEECQCDIITATPAILAKYEKLASKDLEEYSIETVKMFYNDAKAAGYKL
tara:strand:+ start:1073 stop:1774 length:702 start_codon:yes stop_codon:yes gene_type:complete